MMRPARPGAGLAQDFNGGDDYANRIYRTGAHGLPDGPAPRTCRTQPASMGAASAALEPFKDVAARVHLNAAEVARHAEIVITMVADGPDVAQVCLGEDGLSQGAMAAAKRG